MPERTSGTSKAPLASLTQHSRCQGVRIASNSPRVSAQFTALQLISLPSATGTGLNSPATVANTAESNIPAAFLAIPATVPNCRRFPSKCFLS